VFRQKDIEVRAEVENPLDTEVTFTLEPWGMPTAMPARTRFTLIAKCPGGEAFEIERHASGEVTVFAPPAS
jgi:hypothetical protein